MCAQSKIAHRSAFAPCASHVRAALLAGVLAASSGAAAEEESSARLVVERSGSLTVSDGSSYYTFIKGGVFSSGPVHMSGRTMEGCWQYAGNNRFVGTVTLGWMNGLSRMGESRRITISIMLFSPNPRMSSVGVTTLQAADAYFLIDEFVAIPTLPLPHVCE